MACTPVLRRYKRSQRWHRLRQAATSLIHWHGDKHGELGTTSFPSYRTTVSNAETRDVIHWDKVTYISFPKIKDLIAKTASKPLRYYDQTKPMIIQADVPQRVLITCLLQEGQPIVCQQEPHGHWDQVCQHRMWTLGYCIFLPVLQYICIGKALHSGVRPQATWSDTSEESRKCPSQTAENASPATVIWCDHQIQAW